MEIFVALLPIVQYPDPRLSKVAEPVTEFNDELRTLAADMAETMYEAPGVGLAATQIGKNIRMVVIDITDEKNGLMTIINPIVTPLTEDLVECEEGCLSLPGLYEKVKRPARVHLSARDLDNNPIELDCDELLSVCVQHETDHLNGTVFVDHLSMLKKQRAVAKLAKKRKEAARSKNRDDE